jgi:hypothetical protein
VFGLQFEDVFDELIRVGRAVCQRKIFGEGVLEVRVFLFVLEGGFQLGNGEVNRVMKSQEAMK